MDIMQNIIRPRPRLLGEEAIHVIVVGCGGIGSRLVPALAKLIATQYRPGLPAGYITLIDPDIVEERNVRRQHFSPADIGGNKAQVLADRYHTEQAPILAIPREVQDAWTGREEVMGIVPLRPEGAQNNISCGLILGCLDSAPVRRWVKTTVNHTIQLYYPDLLYIDAGNDGDHGQVVLHGLLTQPPGMVSIRGDEAFPNLWAETMSEEDRATPSCGQAADTQTITANQLAATLQLCYVDAIFNARPIGNLGMTFTTLGMIEPIRGEMTQLIPGQIRQFSPRRPAPPEVGGSQPPF